MNKIKIEDRVFLAVSAFLLIAGLSYPLVHTTEVNTYENRNAYKLPTFSWKTFWSKTFQDEYELALSDQIPYANALKMGTNYVNLELKMAYYGTKERDVYNRLYGNINLYNDVLVYTPYEANMSALDDRIKDIEKAVSNNPEIDYYLYYIEKDTDVNFMTGKKMGVYEYIDENLDNKIMRSKFEIEDFEQYKDEFYRSDHHWNYKGSYRGYREVVNLLDIGKPIEIDEKIELGGYLVGSKARSVGGISIFKENTSLYTFDLSKHDIYIDKTPHANYSDYKEVIASEPDTFEYGDICGWDYGLVEFDYNAPMRENTLVIGDSYDNAISELLASHFNKTYYVDVRWYEKNLNEKFDFSSFVSKYEIKNVLFIGHGDYFMTEEFMMGSDK